MSFLREAFSDDKNEVSSMRLCWFLTIMIIFCTWSFLCIKSNMLYSFQIGDASLIAFLFGGKIGQKYFETKNVGSNNNSPK